MTDIDNHLYIEPHSKTVLTLATTQDMGFWSCYHFADCCHDFVLFLANVDSPLYIRPHSKTILTLAITQDTEFLSSHLVMDYSLLVGVDDSSKELVIGIIGRFNIVTCSDLYWL